MRGTWSKGGFFFLWRNNMAARIHVLRKRRDDAKEQARAILDAAEKDDNRSLSDDEAKKFDELEVSIQSLEADIAREEKLIEIDRKLAQTEPPPAITGGDDRRAQASWSPEPWDESDEARQHARETGLGLWAIAVRAATQGRGMDPKLVAAATGHGEALPSEGGFAVPPEFAPGIEREMFTLGRMLSLVDERVVSGNAITYNVLDETSRADSSRQGGILGYWVDEGTAPTLSKTKIAQMEMKLRKVGAVWYFTDELMQDAPALGREVATMFRDELIFQVENKIFRGKGGKVPLGFMEAPCLVSVAKESGQAAATILVENLSNMWARLPAASKTRAVWLINVDCEPQIDELALIIGTTGVLQPRFVNYDAQGILRIKGRPVIQVEYSETVGTKGDIALTDLSRYRLIRKSTGIQQDSSMHVKFIEGEETFRAFFRVDGQPVPRAAMTPFKGANKISPFVVLDTRA